ncbi:alpha/beta fold hydrolase [Streptomyces sp. NPDC087658]|uniref:alpha/beta hydrolase n=1 Tax=Streptomyces sp. NPDC087658 TaxID=3365800 RepID=UPI00382FCCF8
MPPRPHPSAHTHAHTPVHTHVRDHGGDGPPLVLLHGAGRSLADWDAVAPLLVPRHRVLAVDLPGHGRSPPLVGPWSFDAMTEVLADVLRSYGIPDAVPVGHSLGGMIALRYAAGHAPVTPGAINLDGFWWGRPVQYPDLDPAVVEQGLARIGGMTRAAVGGIVPAEYVEQQVAYAALFGIPPERAEATTRASVRELPDGRFQLLPERASALEMYDALDALDLMALLRAMPCPALCVRGRRAQPPMPGLAWLDELFGAYAKGLDRDLARIAQTRPTTAPLTVEDLDATHAMLLEEPEEVAARVLAFTETLGGQPKVRNSHGD